VTEGATTELQAGIIAKNLHQRRHMPNVNTTEATGITPGMEAQS